MISKTCLLLIIQLLIELSKSQVPPTAFPSGIVWKPCTKFNSQATWLQYTNGMGITSRYCYFFSPTYFSYSWHQANSKCVQMNATLATIHDGNTNYFLSHRQIDKNSYSDPLYFWIGMNSLSKRGSYKWTDKTENEMYYFANITSQGEPLPKNILDQGRCVSIKSMSRTLISDNKNIGLWFKDNCLSNHRYICQKRTDQMPTSTPAPPPLGNCPSDWFQYANEKCIKYINVSMTFNESRDLCFNKYGAEMLSIHSEEEQNFITAYTADKNPPYIGFKRSKSDYKWTWQDSKPTDFTNWGVYNVDYYSKLSSAIVVTNNTQPGKWAPVSPDEKHSVICERELEPSITKPGLTYVESKCQIPGYENFIQYRNSCYAVLDSDPNKFLNFSDAEIKCHSMNSSHLVSIVDPFEEAFLRYYIKQYGKSEIYWIGLQSRLSADTNVSQVFEWTDDWPVYYTNWDKYEPQFAGLPQEECVAYAKSNGTWRTTSCDSTNAYVCKITANEMPLLNADKSGVCPQLKGVSDKTLQWVDIDRRSQYCYWFSQSISYKGLQSWVDASFRCRQRKATLASIHSSHELMLLKSKLSQTQTSYNSWIGLTSDPNGDYMWEDGSGVDFTNWDPDQKIVTKTDEINDNSRRQCIEVKRTDGMWKQMPCAGNDRNYFVCQTKKIYHSQPGQPTESPINTKQQKSSKSKSLSGGAKAGIAFGVIGGVVVIGVIGFFIFKRMKANAPPV